MAGAGQLLGNNKYSSLVSQLCLETLETVHIV